MLITLIIIVGLIMFQVGFEEPDNEGLEQMAIVMTIPLALVLSSAPRSARNFYSGVLFSKKSGLSVHLFCSVSST